MNKNKSKTFIPVVFCVQDDLLYIVTENWWNKKHFLDDSISPENQKLFQKLKELGFPQEKESTFYLKQTSEEEIINILSDNGFIMIHNEEFNHFIKD